MLGDIAKGVRVMLNSRTLAVIAAIAALATLRTVASSSESSPEVVALDGAELYRLHCAGCHANDRTGYPPHYPSLLGAKDRLSKDEVGQAIAEGKGTMPSFSHLSEDESASIIAFLFDEKLPAVQLSSAGLGEKIFKSNCSSCHRATVNDPTPPNTWMMEPAALAGASKRFSKAEFLRMLETGVCYMPSFEHFTSPEKEALYSFVKSLEGKGEPPRPTMGEMCPMMMRMRKAK